MGNGTSKKNKGAIFIRYDNKVCWSELELVVSMALMMQVHKVEFDRGTNARDLQEQLAVVAGYNR